MTIFNSVYKSFQSRTPWANTVAYYPLTINANDESWNGYDATSYDATFSSSDGAYFGTATARLELPSMTIWQIATISVWIKTPNWITGNQEYKLYVDWSYNNRNMLYRFTSSSLDCWTWNNTTSQNNYGVPESPWTWWNNYILVKNWTSLTLYKNWVSIWTHTSPYNTSIPWWNNTISLPHQWTDTSEYSALGYLKDYIIEDVARTAQEVSDYYDLTKAYYWIS